MDFKIARMRNWIRKSKFTKKSPLILLPLKMSITETKIQFSKVGFKPWRRGSDYQTTVSRRHPGSGQRRKTATDSMECGEVGALARH